MSDRLFVDIASVLGLGIAAAAVCDLLIPWHIAWIQAGYMVYAIAVFAFMGLVLLSKRASAHFQEICREQTRLLILRLVVSIAFFLLGWYINAAMTSLYGKDSARVAYNSARLFAVSATMIGHVVYCAFSQKVRKHG